MKLGASVAAQIASILTKEVTTIIEDANKKFTRAMKDLASSTLAKADELASARLHSTRQEYVDALKLEKIGPNIYSVSLDDEAAHLETGYESFNMIAHGLARGPKSKVSKDGYRYVSIPFGANKNAKPGTPNGDKQIQHTETVEQRGWQPGASDNAGVKPAVGLHSGTSLSAGLKELEKKSGMSKLQPGVTGKVGTWTQHPFNKNQALFTDPKGNQKTIELDGPMNPLLNGMSKYQSQVGKSTKASYMSFRTASENPNAKGKWQHPGFAGIFVFNELESWANEQMEKIARDLE